MLCKCQKGRLNLQGTFFFPADSPASFWLIHSTGAQRKKKLFHVPGGKGEQLLIL